MKKNNSRTITWRDHRKRKRGLSEAMRRGGNEEENEISRAMGRMGR
jgi:hypothetical protein